MKKPTKLTIPEIRVALKQIKICPVCDTPMMKITPLWTPEQYPMTLCDHDFNITKTKTIPKIFPQYGKCKKCNIEYAIIQAKTQRPQWTIWVCVQCNEMY